MEEFLSGRDPLPVRGRIPTGSLPATGPWKNSYRVATRYRSMEEFLSGRESILGKMYVFFIVRDCSNYSVFSLYAIDME